MRVSPGYGRTGYMNDPLGVFDLLLFSLSLWFLILIESVENELPLCIYQDHFTSFISYHELVTIPVTAMQGGGTVDLHID